MKPELIQNLQILGTIGDCRDEFVKICERMEQIASFAYDAYLQQDKCKNLYSFIRLKDDQYLLLAIKEGAKHNPYFSICGLYGNSHNTYVTDISMLSPILDDYFLMSFKSRILSSFEHQLSLQAAIDEMEQYINEYDASFDIAEN